METPTPLIRRDDEVDPDEEIAEDDEFILEENELDEFEEGDDEEESDADGTTESDVEMDADSEALVDAETRRSFQNLLISNNTSEDDMFVVAQTNLTQPMVPSGSIQPGSVLSSIFTHGDIVQISLATEPHWKLSRCQECLHSMHTREPLPDSTNLFDTVTMESGDIIENMKWRVQIVQYKTDFLPMLIQLKADTGRFLTRTEIRIPRTEVYVISVDAVAGTADTIWEVQWEPLKSFVKLRDPRTKRQLAVMDYSKDTTGVENLVIMADERMHSSTALNITKDISNINRFSTPLLMALNIRAPFSQGSVIKIGLVGSLGQYFRWCEQCDRGNGKKSRWLILSDTYWSVNEYWTVEFVGEASYGIVRFRAANGGYLATTDPDGFYVVTKEELDAMMESERPVTQFVLAYIKDTNRNEGGYWTLRIFTDVVQTFSMKFSTCETCRPIEPTKGLVFEEQDARLGSVVEDLYRKSSKQQRSTASEMARPLQSETLLALSGQYNIVHNDTGYLLRAGDVEPFRAMRCRDATRQSHLDSSIIRHSCIDPMTGQDVRLQRDITAPEIWLSVFAIPPPKEFLDGRRTGLTPYYNDERALWNIQQIGSTNADAHVSTIANQYLAKRQDSFAKLQYTGFTSLSSLNTRDEIDGVMAVLFDSSTSGERFHWEIVNVQRPISPIWSISTSWQSKRDSAAVIAIRAFGYDNLYLGLCDKCRWKVSSSTGTVLALLQTTLKDPRVHFQFISVQ